jgi:hypothetical protein
MARVFIENGDIKARLASATVFRRNGRIHTNPVFNIGMGFREVVYDLVEAQLFIVP